MKQVRNLFFLMPLVFQTLSANSQNLDIYRLSTYYSDEGDNFGFVSLTDGFPFSDHPDSLVIAGENLGNINLDAVKDNSHTLDPIYRQRFLSRLHIEESDQLYIYHLLKDTIYTFNVSDLPLVAYLTPYEPQLPIPDNDYFIGFKLKNIPESMNIHGADFVSISKACPFQTGKLNPMIWTEMETESFPYFHKVKDLPSELDSFHVRDIYQYNLEGLAYYVMSYAKPHRTEIRHLLIVDALTNQLVYDKVFLQEGDYDLINLNVKRHDESSSDCQWAGKLFNNEPTIFFNFIQPMFGCNSLYFVDEKQSTIEISCDNRH